jgi:hypothetical protein
MYGMNNITFTNADIFMPAVALDSTVPLFDRHRAVQPFHPKTVFPATSGYDTNITGFGDEKPKYILHIIIIIFLLLNDAVSIRDHT